MRVQELAARNAALAESILRVARGPRALRSADGVVRLVYEAPLTADSARFWLDGVTRELALYPAAGGGGMPLVVALFSAPERAREKTASYWTTRELVQQTRAASACVVTVNLFSTAEWLRAGTYVAHDAARRAVTRWLSACGLYARFGSPGPMVERWAVGDVRRWYRWYPLTSQLVDARRPVRRRDIQPMLGESDLPWWAARWLEAGCLLGATSACLRATGLDAWGVAPYSAWETVPPERVLASLLASGSPERFAAFWRSPLRAEAAVASAYHAPAAGLVRDALLHWYRVPSSGGPRVDARVALAGVVWAALAVLLAMLAGRRWKAVV